MYRFHFSPRRTPTIAALLYGVNALTVAAGFIVITLWLDKSMKSAAENQLRNDMAAAAAVIGGLLEGEDGDVALPPTEKEGKARSNLSDLRLTLVSRDGTVVWDTATDEPLENHLDRPEIKAVFATVPLTEEKLPPSLRAAAKQPNAALTDGLGASDIRRSTVTGDDVMYYAIPITRYCSATPSALSGETYALRLACPIRRTVYYAHSWHVRRILAAIAVAAAVLSLTYLASRFIVHGINALRQEAHSLTGGGTDCHVPLYAPREVLLLQSDMEKMAAELHRLERVRKDFVANVSHELRTPVTSIVGFSETLLDTIDDDTNKVASSTPHDDGESPSSAVEAKSIEQGETIPIGSEAREFLQIINTQGKRLMAIIEDLLTLSRLERDSMKPEMTRCRISELTEMVCGNFMANADKRGTALTFVSDKSSAKCSVMLNEQLYEEALGNIIDNAIKYCPPKSHIEVKVKSVKTADAVHTGSKTVCVTVTDDGPGIPEKYQARVFERFFRVDKGRSRDMGGTGLGLSISAHIVQSHGGTLRSTGRADGKSGAVFVMTLPQV